MVNESLFKVIEAQDVIKTLPIILHEKAENPGYIFNSEFSEDNEDVKRSIRYFGIQNIPEKRGLDHFMGYLTENIENRGNFNRGVIFTNFEDKIAIFHRAPTGSIHNDYTLILRARNKILYRGGIIPGKGYQYEKNYHDIVPGENYIPFELKLNSICPIPENIRLASILAGFNPNI